jgi:hypothetical protein
MNELNMIRVLLDEAPPSAEVIAEGRRRVAAGAAAPGRPGAGRAYPQRLYPRRSYPQSLYPQRRGVRVAVAFGAAAVVAAAAVTAVTAGVHRTPGNTAISPAQARTVAYVTSRVENALVNQDLVYVGRTSTSGFPSVAMAYRNQSVWEQLYPATDYRDRIVNGKRLWDFPPQDRGKLASAQGTALVGGKLVSALVTYYNDDYVIYGPAVQPRLSPCSVTAALVMASAPVIPSFHWTTFLDATLRCGAAAVTGHVKIGGVETTEITGKPITVKLQPGYGKLVGAKWVTARWTLYVNPATYLPVRFYGSLEQFGGTSGTSTTSGVTDVQWLAPTPANIARTLVTIPRGFHRMGPNYTG